MKLEPTSSTRNRFNTYRVNGIVFFGSDCPKGRLDAPHFIADHLCACVAVVPARDCATDSASVAASRPRVGTRAPRDLQPGWHQFQPAEPCQLEMEIAQ